MIHDDQLCGPLKCATQHLDCARPLAGQSEGGGGESEGGMGSMMGMQKGWS